MADEELALLYVEDDAMIRAMSTLALEDAGYVVVASADGRSALEILATDASSFCAVVTDINLGVGPSGWDVAKRARGLSATIPVIYVTGAAGSRLESQGRPGQRHDQQALHSGSNHCSGLRDSPSVSTAN